MAWWHPAFDELIADARTLYQSTLGADARFPDAQRALKEFKHLVGVWRDRRDAAAARGVQEKINELAAAAALLSRMEHDQTLTYEPPLKGTKKTIDFLVNTPSERLGWIDVKTVAPEWSDTDKQWRRFEQTLERAPKNVVMIRAREWGGAGIANQDLKTRWSFIRRTVELEKKVAALDHSQRAPVAMLFCTYGFAWKSDALEDFADFYRTGRFRADDWFGDAITKFMADEGMAFDRSLAGFHFLERKQFDATRHRFGTFVTGPVIGR